MNRIEIMMLGMVLSLAAGCRSNPHRPAAVLGLNDQGRTVSLREGEEVIIVLRDPAGGAIWTEAAENPGSSGVVQRIVDSFAAESGKFRYRAIAPGETTMRFEQKRPLTSAATTQPLKTVS